MKPITANRYYVQDEWGEILVETGHYYSALRIYARAKVVDGKNVRLIDRKEEDEDWQDYR